MLASEPVTGPDSSMSRALPWGRSSTNIYQDHVGVAQLMNSLGSGGANVAGAYTVTLLRM